ncbi:unnamed protein product [Rotaria sp. Silwood2]|nr:unnamed protein product [Rotaria sp. Silwood2]CAF2628255.1 unnamed protein product [Rotaria sp. Silwood2]CAF2853515.1 unnamed protein product [Rotaria sp. Silwood2]CAF2996286.1 unnamed protein product [Rotaria sp. Silwood2]CAF3968101.1 unnamed protein product [Rotaria sp. Silwood2]
MSNSTTTSVKPSEALIVAYYPFTLVIVGTLLNLLTFFILCRPTFRDTKKQPIIHYMRTIAIFDILMLYGWNLDHYLSITHGFILLTYSIATCKAFGFLNYFASQSSAWLRVFICLDRYLSVSRLHRTWFSRPKSVLIIITCIITFFTLFNFHFLIFTCFYRPSGSINPNAQLYKIYPLWDYINLGVYNCAPFILMVTFNSGVIYHLIRRRNTRMIQNSNIQHRAISITLVLTTFLFLIMTIPATIVAAFFFTTPTTTLAKVLDSALYTYHITSFPLYFITFNAFRRECIMMITCKKNTQRVVPSLPTPGPPNTQNQPSIRTF